MYQNCHLSQSHLGYTLHPCVYEIPFSCKVCKYKKIHLRRHHVHKELSMWAYSIETEGYASSSIATGRAFQVERSHLSSPTKCPATNYLSLLILSILSVNEDGTFNCDEDNSPMQREPDFKSSGLLNWRLGKGLVAHHYKNSPWTSK